MQLKASAGRCWCEQSEQFPHLIFCARLRYFEARNGAQEVFFPRVAQLKVIKISLMVSNTKK